MNTKQKASQFYVVVPTIVYEDDCGYDQDSYYASLEAFIRSYPDRDGCICWKVVNNEFETPDCSAPWYYERAIAEEIASDLNAGIHSNCSPENNKWKEFWTWSLTKMRSWHTWKMLTTVFRDTKADS